MSSDFSAADIEALQSLIEALAIHGQWSREPPEFVNQLDETSRTRPEDEPVRTVGLLLTVNSPSENPGTPLAEVTRVIDALTELSEARAVDFELQLEATYVGEIRRGVPDRLIREGLLARW